MALDAKSKNKIIRSPAKLTERKFKCDKCGRKYISNSFLNKHIILCAKSDVQKETQPDRPKNLPVGVNQRRIKCSKCNFRFYKKDHLARHFTRIHLKDVPKKFKCSKCPSQFTGRQALVYHLLTQHKIRVSKIRKKRSPKIQSLEVRQEAVEIMEPTAHETILFDIKTENLLDKTDLEYIIPDSALNVSSEEIIEPIFQYDVNCEKNGEKLEEMEIYRPNDKVIEAKEEVDGDYLNSSLAERFKRTFKEVSEELSADDKIYLVQVLNEAFASLASLNDSHERLKLASNLQTVLFSLKKLNLKEPSANRNTAKNIGSSEFNSQNGINLVEAQTTLKNTTEDNSSSIKSISKSEETPSTSVSFLTKSLATESQRDKLRNNKRKIVEPDDDMMTLIKRKSARKSNKSNNNDMGKPVMAVKKTTAKAQILKGAIKLRELRVIVKKFSQEEILAYISKTKINQ